MGGEGESKNGPRILVDLSQACTKSQLIFMEEIRKRRKKKKRVSA